MDTQETGESTSSSAPTDFCYACVKCGEVHPTLTNWVIWWYCKPCIKLMAEEMGVTVVTTAEELKAYMEKGKDDGTDAVQEAPRKEDSEG